jgi:hypothetical protein
LKSDRQRQADKKAGFLLKFKEESPPSHHRFLEIVVKLLETVIDGGDLRIVVIVGQ